MDLTNTLRQILPGEDVLQQSRLEQRVYTSRAGYVQDLRKLHPLNQALDLQFLSHAVQAQDLPCDNYAKNGQKRENVSL